MAPSMRRHPPEPELCFRPHMGPIPAAQQAHRFCSSPRNAWRGDQPHCPGAPARQPTRDLHKRAPEPGPFPRRAPGGARRGNLLTPSPAARTRRAGTQKDQDGALRALSSFWRHAGTARRRPGRHGHPGPAPPGAKTLNW